MQKSLLIFGGNGFVGSAICKYAVSQGVRVLSVSRSGAPSSRGAWSSKVEYIRGDAMDPSTYKDLLPEVSAVVHSIGVLIDSKIQTWSDKYEGSYEHLSRDTALTVLSEFQSFKKPFVFVSAQKGLFLFPRYISTKREVEAHLESIRDSTPSTVIRPGFMYSEDSTPKRAIGKVIDLMNCPNAILNKGGLGWVAENFVPAKSLSVDVVGKTAVLCAFKSELLGRTLDVPDIANVDEQFFSIH